PTTVDTRDENTPDSFVFRDPAMVRLTGKHPFNAEPPLKVLEQAGFVTPNQLHFVRNHGPVPQIVWDEHRIEITGLVHRPVILSMQDILSLPPVTIPVTMVCAGNRRKEQNMTKQSIGFGWGAAGASTACWTGVYLRDVINHFAGGLLDNTNYICFDGCDTTSKGAYGTSLAANRAMSDHYDVLLAYKMNGELLPPDHGYPVRVLIPGCIGGRSVKWLARIEASETESKNIFHSIDNKVLPTQVQSAEQATAEDWWHRPEYTLYDLNINSAISSPDHDERIPLMQNGQFLDTPYRARGYAYTGGNRRITRVEASIDGGETWLLCTLERPDAATLACLFGGELRGPSYYQRSRQWAWTRWHVDIPRIDLLTAQEMVVRAWDESQNTQPEKLTWNLMGMMNNCWFRVKLRLDRSPSDLAIQCSHPTLAGPVAGGWMSPPPKAEEEDASQKQQSSAKPSSLPVYSLAEVEKHTSDTDCWIIVNDKVYDCTPFLKDHPGGASSILITGGTDTTEEFDAIHSSKAQAMLEDYLIGPTSSTNSSNSSSRSSMTSTDDQIPFLHQKQWKKLVLESKQHLSPTIRIYRFTFDAAWFGLPIGQHVYLKLPEEARDASQKPKSVMRAYTPSRCGPGYVEFLIKVYYPDHRQPGGKLTQLLDKVRIGETVDCKGPLGEYEYLGDGRYTIEGVQTSARHIGMIAGGTGITPMWQVLDALRHDDPSSRPCVSLIYCARHLEDLVLTEELEALQAYLGPDRLHLRYILSTPPKDAWEHGSGRLSLSDVQEHLFPFATSQVTEEDKVVLLCGSDAMIEQSCKP
ncbi:Oxidoreductase, molybdopterin-binding domain-containing protein, partial [Syncephalastrum racemosum]